MPKFSNLSKLSDWLRSTGAASKTYQNLPEYLEQTVPKGKIPSMPESSQLEKLLRQHPGMSEDLAQLKISGSQSPRLKEMAEMPVEIPKQNPYLAIGKERNPSLGDIDPSEKTKIAAGLGAAALGAKSAEAAPFQNPYEGFSKESLFYKDIPEQYQRQEAESPELDPLDLVSPGGAAKTGAKGFSKLFKYLK